MKKYLSITALLLLAAIGPVAAQTGRIAHFSHGGSAATLASAEAAADNFGTPPAYFAVDSVRYLSETTIVGYGRWRWSGRKETIDTLHLPQKMSAAQAARYVRGGNSDWSLPYTGAKRAVKLVGFDSTSQARPDLPSKRKTKRKQKAAITGGLPTSPPMSPGLVVVLLAGLAGAGWLLGERPRLVVASAA